MLPAALLVGFVLVGTLLAFNKWRTGVFMAIVAGMIQDPIRKLTPGTPPILVLASVPIWIAVYTGVIRHERAARLALRHAYPRLFSAAGLFAASLVLPAVLAFQYGLDGWQMAVLGLFGYLSPLFGVLVGFAFARQVSDVRRLLVFYSVVSAAMLVGTALEYLHVFPGSLALGTDAMGARWVRTALGGVVELYSGFFRSPDVMGWHAAALLMFALGLVMQRRGGRDRLWLLLAGWGGLCLLLAGRRKMSMMPIIWAACVAIALVGSGRFRRAVTLAVTAGTVAFGIYYASGEIDVHEKYYVYAGTVTGEGPARVIEDAWGSVWMTYAQAGVLGRGLGSASQGARYLTVFADESWQESGPSKVMAELGLPGFLCAVLLVWRVSRALSVVARDAMARQGDATLSLPLIGFTVANLACFTISHQVYSDAVILTLTSILLGTALAAHRWTVVLPRPKGTQRPLAAAAAPPLRERAG